MRRFRPTGSSMIEVLVVSALFLGALILLSTLFVYTTRSTTQGNENVDLREQSLQAVEEIRRSMSHSHQSGNSLFTQSGALGNGDLVLCFISTIGPDGPDWDPDAIRPIFHGYDIYFRDQASNELRKIQVPINPPTVVANPLPEADITTQIGSGPATLLCPNVTDFEAYIPIDRTPTMTWANPLGVRIVQTNSRNAPLVTELPYRYPNI